MDIRPLTPTYAVSPQIEPTDIYAIREAGFTTIICNRPDMEVPPAVQSDAIRTAAEAAGLEFKDLPVTHQTLTPEIIAEQKRILDGSSGPVLAYCASGTRSSILWSLGQAGERPADEIIAATAQAGYDLAGLRPQIEQLAKS
ncbi:TIGR01244 family sulfur transferase [Aestuariibius insulae]|uniref:TIGR01244 family sulfur transferase n=1 Tax=Aestuariibius insulae TaxID=2058287 RepID=UPI00345E5475